MRLSSTWVSLTEQMLSVNSSYLGYFKLKPHKSKSVFQDQLTPLQLCIPQDLLRLSCGTLGSTCIRQGKTMIPKKCPLALVTVYGVDPQVGQSLDGLSVSLCSTHLCNSFHGYFVPSPL